ncbi:MAG: DUF1592 domain-containing protein [Planctomycetales bacterium]|nr:DUF1592 domain-containing protein [Planctomycetales bacterium]
MFASFPFPRQRFWMGLACCALLSARVAVGQETPRFEPDSAGFQERVLPFLTTHCLDCHGPDDAQAELRVDRDLTADLSDRANRERWGEVVNALNSHSMPPEDSPQPAVELVGEVVDWVTAQAALAEQVSRDSQVTLRRLNRIEYRNTIRDLTGVDFDISGLPQDPSAGGFDNNGFALSLSPLHLELYHASARKIIDAALVTGEQPPAIQWRFEVDSGDSDSNRVRYGDNRVIVNGGRNAVEDGLKRIHHESWDRSISIRDFQLEHGGEYVLRIRAASIVPDRDAVIASAEHYLAERRDRDIANRPDAERHFHEQYERDLEHFRTDGMYDYGPARIRVIRSLGGQPAVVAEFDVPASPDDLAIYEVRVPMTTERAGFSLEYAYSIPRVLENFWMQTGDDFARPELLIDWAELEGPVYEAWPPRGTRLLLGDSLPANIEELPPDEQRAFAARIMERFMNRAFRRPVTGDEVGAKLAHFDRAIEAGEPWIEAIKAPLVATLISPHFLFLVEPTTDETGDASRLTAHQRAARLSYFLWSSMPDEQLRRLADDGSLLEPEVWHAEIDRLLGDPRSEALVENFTSQWLGLREVGANPPAEDLYPHYDRHLEMSMVGESLALFREALRNDLPLSTFVRTDWVMINERLGRYYGIPGVRGDEFRRVPLPPDVRRGGVMTHASILTVTSNGTRTSPVKRGVWVLETMLGIEPGLPVANAGEIGPTVPGLDKATVRQRLEIHRTLPQCARCHARIDPLGFALENFNAAGAWRDQEGFGYKGRVSPNDPVIDASSRLPDGTEIVGVDGLQDALMARRSIFHACLTRKLMTYALGRELSLADTRYVEAGVESLEQPGQDSLRALIHFIASSEPFVTK